MNSLSIVIVDDHTLFRTGLYEILSRRHLSVVGMTGIATEALSLIEETNPDIVLLDLRMQELSGLEVLKQIRTAVPEQCVVILTTSVEEQDLLKALKLGASGYLLKDMDPDEFTEQLHQAKAGEKVIATDLTGLLAQALVSEDQLLEENATNVYKLTPRETDILHHIAKGKSNRDIADSLGIGTGTVKLHVRAVLKKLGVQSRVQAAILALSENLCSEKGGQ